MIHFVLLANYYCFTSENMKTTIINTNIKSNPCNNMLTSVWFNLCAYTYDHSTLYNQHNILVKQVTKIKLLESTVAVL